MRNMAFGKLYQTKHAAKLIYLLHATVPVQTLGASRSLHFVSSKKISVAQSKQLVVP
jgi:hypothetical protein